MKIIDYPEIFSLEDEDLFIVETDEGTRRVKASNVNQGTDEPNYGIPFEEDPAILHRNHFRGKNLGNVITDEQVAKIKDGTFEDLWVGDYWNLNGVAWRIADINYFNVEYSPTSYGSPGNNIILFPDTALTRNSQANIGTPFGPKYHDYLKNNARTLLPTTVYNNMINDYYLSIFSVDAKSNMETIETASINTGIFAPGESMLFGEGSSANRYILPGLSVIPYPQMALFKFDFAFATDTIANHPYFLNYKMNEYPVAFQLSIRLHTSEGQMGIRPFVAIG